MSEVQRTERPRFVVGIGASAGGLEALEEFFRSCPSESGLAFVVVQHLSPDHKSHMVELLSKHTKMRVVAAEDGTRLCADTVYLIPPKKVMTVKDAALMLRDRGSGLTLPVDILLRSLAEDLGHRAAGVILSGTGSDGARGLRALKEAGGLSMVQDPTSAKFDGMPRAALSAGIVDFVLPVAEMPMKLASYVHHSEVVVVPGLQAEVSTLGAYAELLELLRRQTGVDFAPYKQTTIGRRIMRRMAISQHATLEEYVQVARSSTEELGVLFKELLISVTKFFRDPEVFEVLRRDVIPSIVDRTSPGETIRVWVAGCATGEEAYSLAMLFDEYFEAGGRPRQVKIFATDIDRDALEFAGIGVYPESVMADVSPERVARYFVRQGESYQVARFIRQRVVFANHDLTKDPPFSRVSLVTCRNLLIYFSAELQATVLSSFCFALRPGGALLLGASETVGDLGDELEVVSASAKLFRRTESRARGAEPRLRVTAKPSADLDASLIPAPTTAAPRHAGLQQALATVMQAYVPPTMVITEQNEVVHVFGEPSPLLRFPSGTPSLNLLQLLPGPVASVVGLALHRALRAPEVVCYRGIATDHGPLTVSVRRVPARLGPVLRLVTLQLETVVTSATGPSEIGADTQRQIAELEFEVRHTKENLQATIEELETSNEELQATNEELVASNEELQSTNEELQSVNEELHSLNHEYQLKIAEMASMDDDINNLLLSTRLGIIFLDAELRITRFTPAMSQYFNVLDRDIGRPITHLSAHFLVGDLFDQLERVRATGEVFEREYSMHGGRLFLARVAPYVSRGHGSNGLVLTVLDVTAVRHAERQTSRVLNALPQHVALVDRNGKITFVNAAWAEFARDNGADQDPRVGVGANYLATCERAAETDPSAAELAARLRDLLARRTDELRLEYPCHSPTEQRWFLMHATVLDGEAGDVVLSHTNITHRKILEIELMRRVGRVGAGDDLARAPDGMSHAE